MLKKVMTLFFALLTLPLFLTACNATSSSKDVTITGIKVTVRAPQPTATYPFKTSKSGTTTVQGSLLVLSPEVALPDENDAVFLVPLDTSVNVTSIPTFKVGEVPQAQVDERTGDFMFVNITPATYAVVILSRNGTQFPGHKNGKTDLIIVKVTEKDKDQLIDVGFVAFP